MHKKMTWNALAFVSNINEKSMSQALTQNIEHFRCASFFSQCEIWNPFVMSVISSEVTFSVDLCERSERRFAYGPFLLLLLYSFWNKNNTMRWKSLTVCRSIRCRHRFARKIYYISILQWTTWYVNLLWIQDNNVIEYRLYSTWLSINVPNKLNSGIKCTKAYSTNANDSVANKTQNEYEETKEEEDKNAFVTAEFTHSPKLYTYFDMIGMFFLCMCVCLYECRQLSSNLINIMWTTIERKIK